MILSTKLIETYEELAKSKKLVAPHQMHKLATDFVEMIIKDMGKESSDNSFEPKLANNIWNFVRLDLISKGYDPYSLKEDGFNAILEKLIAEQIIEAPKNGRS